MTVDALMAILTKMGFPIAVAVWLLYRMDNLMVLWLDNQTRIAVLLDQLIQMHK